MSTAETSAGRIGWHELLTPDVEAAKSFYGRLLAWETEIFKPGEADYLMISAAGTQHGGFLREQPAPDAPPHWQPYVYVESAEGAANRATAAGGTVLHGPLEIPDVGTILIVADPQGAAIAAIQGAGEAPVAEGVFVWDELHTTDVEAVKGFYESVFGWSSQEMEMAGAGTYTIFQRGEKQVAGAMAKQAGDPSPPHWLTYIGVEDVDATTADARELGATVFVEPTDIPGVGRFSLIADPTGAAVGLFRAANQGPRLARRSRARTFRAIVVASAD